MTAHSGTNWELDKELKGDKLKSIVNETVGLLEDNLRYNANGYYTCGAYFVGSEMEQLVYCISNLLDECKEKVITKVRLDKFLEGDAPISVKQIVPLILRKMRRYNN